MKALKPDFPKMCHEIDVTLPCFFGHQMDQPVFKIDLITSPFCWGGVEVCPNIWSNGGGKVTECLFKTPWPNFISRELYWQIGHVQHIFVLQAAFNGFSTIVTWHDIGTMKGSNEALAEGIPDDLKKKRHSSCTLRMWWEYYETHETGYFNHESDLKYGEKKPWPQWKKHLTPSERQLWKDFSEIHKAW